MSDSLNTLVADYGKQEATLTPTAKEARQKAIRAKEAEYQARARQLEDSVQRREREVMRPLMERINKTIEAIRAEEGYAMIFDAGNIWDQPREFDPTRLFRGAGVGVALITPLGPLGLDWAYGFDRVDAQGRPDPKWQLHFRLGNIF